METGNIRARRQRAIADLIRCQALSSQEEVTEKLAGLGFAVTQATVSRDLEQLGAVKVKRGGVLSYALPEQIGESDWASARLANIFRDWVLSVESAGPIIVIKTPPGSAHLVGIALDQTRLSEIAGTVSGDDTIFLAVRNGHEISTVVERFQALAGQAKSGTT